MRFLGYIISHQGIQIEKEQIKAIYDWSKLQLICDIQVFLGFANFYQQFIQGFSRLAALLTSMLKTASTTGPAVSIGVGDENLEQDG